MLLFSNILCYKELVLRLISGLWENLMEGRSEIAWRWHHYRASKIAVVWYCTCSIFATVALGFGSAGWQTGGRAAASAARAADDARIELAAEVCVSQFMRSPDRLARLASLRNAFQWQRTTFMNKQGWATLPGMQPVDGAAGLCAERLLAAKTPPA